MEIRAAKIRVDQDDAAAESRQLKADRRGDGGLAGAALSSAKRPDLEAGDHVPGFHVGQGKTSRPKDAVCAMPMCCLVIILSVRPLIIAGIVLGTTACGMGATPPAPEVPPWRMTKDASGVDVRLLEKLPYTYLYALDGSLRELRLDRNNDHKPDVFAHFSGRSTPDRLEIDENGDGKLDRWEIYNEKGQLVRYSTSAKGGAPERFFELDPSTKEQTQVETDTDHDGRRERLEVFVKGRLVRVDLDTNADGKKDRVQDWAPGYLASEDVDRDGDGRADVRIRYSRNGSVLRLERLGK